MNVYTYSEARQRFARLLDEARAGSGVRIKRRDGSEFTVVTRVTAEDIVSAIRESRERVAPG